LLCWESQQHNMATAEGR